MVGVGVKWRVGATVGFGSRVRIVVEVGANFLMWFSLFN